MSSTIVLQQANSKTLTLTLNKPKTLNALDLELATKFYQALSLVQSGRFNLLLFQGSGKAFCAGGDLKSLINHENSADIARAFDVIMGVIDRIYYRIATLPILSIAIMDGLTVGGGAGLPLMAKFRIATENTCFYTPGMRLGLTVEGAILHRHTKLEGYLGRYIALCAVSVNGEDMLLAGIATHYIESSRTPEMKESLYKLVDPTEIEISGVLSEFSKKPSKESYLSREQKRTIDSCFQFDTIEEILQKLQEDGSPFAMATIKELRKGSPTSLKFTLEAMRKISHSSLETSILIGRNSTPALCRAHDIKEGYHSSFVKRQRPQWSPEKFEDVDLQNYIRVKFFEEITPKDCKEYFQDASIKVSRPAQTDFNKSKLSYDPEAVARL